MQKKEQHSVFFPRNAFEKIILLMKLTFLLTIAFSLQVSAKLHSQTILSLTVKKMPIGKVFLEIEKRTKYRFLFNNDLAPLSKKIDLSVEREEATAVLDKILSGTMLDYKLLEGDVIAITRRDEPASQKIKVTGKVTNEKGEPVLVPAA